jgi:hypothetical protein
MLDITLLPSAKVPLIYPDTNGMTTEWYRFFWNVYSFTGNATGAIPVNKGGTGLTSIGNHQLIIGNAAGVFEKTELVGSGITITYAPGTTTLAIGNSGVTPGTYGTASSVGQFTVDVHGTLTFAQNIAIAIDANQITSGIINSARISGSYTGITGVGTLTVGTWNASTIGANYGGTGQVTYAIGDMLYATSAAGLSKLTIGASTYILTSSGTAPQWTLPSTVAVGTATNLAGGLANQIPYQTGANVTSFITAPTIAGTYLNWSGSAFQWSVNPLGDVIGPASATDNAIARFDTTTGKLIQNSVVTIGDTGAATGFTTLSASTSVSTPIIKATSSAGGALQNTSGTNQIQWGAGGGDNVTIDVSTNINGTNAQIDISPTGTGHVHINPTGVNSIQINPTYVGTMDNMTIGATTPKAITGTTITATTFNGSGSGLTSIPNSALTNSTISGVALGGSLFNLTAGTGVSFSAGTTYNGSAAITINATGSGGTVTSVAATVPSFLSVSGSPITTSGTLAISYSGTALPILNGGTGQTTASAAFNALSPLTTAGDVLYGGTSGAGTRLGIGTAGQVLTVNAGATAPQWSTPTTGTVTSVAQSFTGGLISVTGSPITTSGTLALTVAGTSGGIPYFSGATTWASSAALTQYGVIYGGGAGAAPVSTAAGTTGQVLIATTSGAPTWGAIPTTAAVTSLSFGTTGFTPSTATTGAITVAGTLVAANGGTGQSSYAVGDILYASTTTALSKLADVATGNALISGGVGVAPSYGKIGLTTHISGTLAVSNGGTGLTTLTAGYIPYGNGTSAFSSSSSLYFDGTSLGIGNTSPVTKLQITVAPTGSQDNGMRVTDGTRLIQTNITGNTYSYIGIGASETMLYSTGNPLNIVSDGQPIKFIAGTAERMRIPSAGGVQAVTTISVGNATPSSSGAGITFPATQSASTDANTLDDYEEGTWTPADASGASLSFTSVDARYTKVGNLVTVYVVLTYPVTASGSQAKISGLPFTPSVFGLCLLLTPGNSSGPGQAIAIASTTLSLYSQNALVKTNVNMSGLTAYISGTYAV